MIILMRRLLERSAEQSPSVSWFHPKFTIEVQCGRACPLIATNGCYWSRSTRWYYHMARGPTEDLFHARRSLDMLRVSLSRSSPSYEASGVRVEPTWIVCVTTACKGTRHNNVQLSDYQYQIGESKLSMIHTTDILSEWNVRAVHSRESLKGDSEKLQVILASAFSWSEVHVNSVFRFPQ